MSARDEIAKVLAVQGWCCSPDDHMNSDTPWENNGDCSDCDSLRFATADALLASPALANLTRERETTRGDLAAAWDDGFTYATRLAYGGPMRDGDPNPYRGTGCSDPTCTEEHGNN